jgi:hypothetical protein
MVTAGLILATESAITWLFFDLNWDQSEMSYSEQKSIEEEASQRI